MKGAKSITSIVLAIALAVALAFVGSEKTAEAYNVNATSTAAVTVTISSKTIVDVTPQTMDFGTANPGSTVTQYTDGGVTLSQIQVENLGSTNLTYIWLNVTQPSSNPFGTGLTSNYDPANWLVVKNTSQTDYAFIDRVEFNATTDIIYLNLDANSRTKGWFGRIRDANHEYFWQINGTASYCNTTGNTLVVGQTAHNETQTGTIDLVNGNVYISSIAASGDANWGITNTTIEGVQYCVATSADCTKLRLYRWNPDAPGAASCPALTQAEMTINNGQTVYPGGSVIVDVQLHVPYGVPQGTMPQGTLTVVAEAA